MRFISTVMKAKILSGFTPRWMENHPRYDYCRAAFLSVPMWIKRRDLTPFYEEARRLTRETGVKHVVDHIVPLKHPFVSGLTVPWNMQVIPAHCNDHKRNKWHPDQVELPLKVIPEQLTLSL